MSIQSMVGHPSNDSKIELRRFEPFCAGGTLVLGLLFGMIASSARVLDFQLDEVDTEEELQHMHDEFEIERSAIMAGAALYWFLLPCYLLHLFFINRVFDSFLSIFDLHVNFPFSEGFRFIYNIVAIINIIVFTCLEPCLMIVTVYFNWDFTAIDGTKSYTGYYIQYSLAHVVTVLHDSNSLALGVASNLPWFWFLLVTLLGTQSRGQEERREEMTGKVICCYRRLGKKVCNCSLVICIVIMAIVTLMALFSWESDGFWSYYGRSQQLNGWMLVSKGGLAIWLFYIGCNFDTIKGIVKRYQNVGQNDEEETGGAGGTRVIVTEPLTEPIKEPAKETVQLTETITEETTEAKEEE